jgi:hypothetical protein
MSLLEQIEEKERQEAEARASQAASESKGVQETYTPTDTQPGVRSTVRTNPVEDAKLDTFIAKQPKLYERYQELPKEDLVRKLMMSKMKQYEYQVERNRPLMDWVEANPDIKEAIELKIKNVPEERREGAFIRAAKDMAATAAINTEKPAHTQDRGVRH